MWGHFFGRQPDHGRARSGRTAMRADSASALVTANPGVSKAASQIGPDCGRVDSGADQSSRRCFALTETNRRIRRPRAGPESDKIMQHQIQPESIGAKTRPKPYESGILLPWAQKRNFSICCLTMPSSVCICGGNSAPHASQRCGPGGANLFSTDGPWGTRADRAAIRANSATAVITANSGVSKTASRIGPDYGRADSGADQSSRRRFALTEKNRRTRRPRAEPQKIVQAPDSA